MTKHWSTLDPHSAGPHIAERYRKELFDLASEGEPAPRDIDALKERFRQEIEDVISRGEAPDIVTWIF